MMNKKLIGVLFALSFPLTATAMPPQQGNSGSFDKGQRIERMTNELGLSEDQKAQVESIFNDQKVKLKAIHEETRARLQGILTQEQMTRFDAMHPIGRHKQSCVRT